MYLWTNFVEKGRKITEMDSPVQHSSNLCSLQRLYVHCTVFSVHISKILSNLNMRQLWRQATVRDKLQLGNIHKLQLGNVQGLTQNSNILAASKLWNF
jgi:hypothetical protein